MDNLHPLGHTLRWPSSAPATDVADAAGDMTPCRACTSLHLQQLRMMHKNTHTQSQSHFMPVTMLVTEPSTGVTRRSGTELRPRAPLMMGAAAGMMPTSLVQLFPMRLNIWSPPPTKN